MQTVLVVDDEQDIRHMLKLMLTMSGYRVVEAADGLDALETAVATLPDLIILDVMLPKLDGYSVCQQLQKIPSTRKIPIIMMSGDSHNPQYMLSKAKQADFFLRKPFQLDQLLANITQALAPHYPLSMSLK